MLIGAALQQAQLPLELVGPQGFGHVHHQGHHLVAPGGGVNRRRRQHPRDALGKMSGLGGDQQRLLPGGKLGRFGQGVGRDQRDTADRLRTLAQDLDRDGPA